MAGLTFADFQALAAQAPRQPLPVPHWDMPHETRACAPKPRNPEAKEPLTIIASGPALPTGLGRKRPKNHGKADPIWDVQLRPKFDKPVGDGLVTPMGTAKPLEGLARFLDRVARRDEEIEAIAKSQKLELPSLAAEFAANGLSASSLSTAAPSNDDELEAANIAEKHLRMVPLKYDPMTVAPLLRRIEWEKYVFACGQPVRIYAKVREDGSRTLAASDVRWSKDQLVSYAPKMRDLLDGRSPEDLVNDRDRALHYKRLVWSLMTPEQQRAWTRREPEVVAYLAPADDNTERERWPLIEERATTGPQELGLHWLDIDLGEDGEGQYIVRTEPSDFEFWPEDYID